MRTCLLLLFGTAFGALPCSATDRVVGVTSLFPTISAAIAASTDGDRILLEAGQYDEYLSLDKDISILSAQEGSRPTIKGQMRFVSGPSDRKILISGIRLLSFMETIGNSARLDLSILDSYLKERSFNGGNTNLHVELLRDTLSRGITFHSGTVIGNVIGGSTDSGSSLINCLPGTSLADPLILIGNILLAGNDGNIPLNEIDLNVSTVFHLENNYCSTASIIRPFLYITGTVPFGAEPSSVTNNTFYRSTAASLPTIAGYVTYSYVDIQNNAVVGDTGPLVTWPSQKGALSNNLYAAPSWINTATGQPTLGSPLINAGHPGLRYLDLDLTTNDVGCYGGSNSRANFTTGMGSAVVGFMQAPRVVAQGQTVNINAVGFDR